MYAQHGGRLCPRRPPPDPMSAQFLSQEE
ncbi:hypothetical protein LINPERPRIM_LOCUS15084 [Linum perenne]